ncbi:MAG: molybdopterin molybdotransferase MoeA [Anaerolineae bacterium]|nr:molybdopterin molybdotransferase MoeA [Anaerolineae bacterium]MCO5191994.1 molybdopterin molybdotransferase MoeA [Anaerolineae bacterium]MCO5199080.1 molybdopterin molybdotransferase MoeA [Anaerolineae bacterium]
MAEVEYLTVADALERVLATVSVLDVESVALSEARHRITAEEVVARDSLPPFDNSSMDGYAVRAQDIEWASAENMVTLRVVGDIAAGSYPPFTVAQGCAARIMTGAPIPAGADAVVPVENTDEQWRNRERPLPDIIGINRAVDSGGYIRRVGSDVTAGAVAINSGQVIRPQEIGMMASLGVARIAVVRRPRVGILATGDELVAVEEALTPGKIRNSNSYAQAAQVADAGGIPVMLGNAGDTEASVRDRLQTGLEAGVDLFVSSAGVSVGAYDVVKAVLESEGTVGFWRVRMRPGKPLAFGRYGGIPFLGLPGNPVSAMLSFERFARPAILKMGGHTCLERPRVTVTVREALQSDGRESYIRAIITRSDSGYEAVTTGGQDSHMITSLVKANGLVIIPAEVRQVAAGEQLEAMMIDWPSIVF